MTTTFPQEIEQITSEWWAQQASSFYLYFENEVRHNLEATAEVLKSVNHHRHQSRADHLFYSLKANPNPFLVDYFKEQSLRFDVSSLLEFRALLQRGVRPEDLSFSGPNKPKDVIEELLEKKVGLIHLDHLGEVTDINHWISLRGATQTRLTLRMAASSASSQKLGFSEFDFDKLIATNHHLKFKLHGFHGYLGRESFSEQNVLDFESKALRWYHKIPSLFAGTALYIGAGLPMPRLGIEPNDLRGLRGKRQTPWPIHFEVGRALVQSAGVYGARVLSVKHDRTQPLIVIDGGLQHTASRFSSPLFAEKAYAVQLRREEKLLQASPEERFSIFGSLGITHDKLIEVTLPRDIQRGDQLLISACGAYGYTAATQQFLGHSEINEFYCDSEGNIRALPSPRNYYDSQSFSFSQRSSA